MTRPRKSTDYRPNERQLHLMFDIGGKSLKKYLRNSSSGYIHKKAVRDYVFSRDGYKCAICGSSQNLQIDHIISVYRATKKTIFDINHINNLRPLCMPCNARRSPNE